jgi:hypothetical protein
VVYSTGVFYAEWTRHEVRIAKERAKCNEIDLTLKIADEKGDALSLR